MGKNNFFLYFSILSFVICVKSVLKSSCLELREDIIMFIYNSYIYIS